ncbi:protogloblin ApPgb [Arthrobacter frigidicola]|nr:protogloblin ApPgb [Arthrobacter frigidicola]
MNGPRGYTYGSADLETSPVSLDDLRKIEETILWTDADRQALLRARPILEPRTDKILDVWYGYVGDHPFLLESFAGADGNPDADYLSAVRERFKAWVVDLCSREHDQDWLNYQHEVGLRHTSAKKNVTDAVESPAAEVRMRYLIGFIVPLTATMRPFLAEGTSDPEELDAMYTAWFKGVTLTAILWSEPYSTSW